MSPISGPTAGTIISGELPLLPWCGMTSTCDFIDTPERRISLMAFCSMSPVNKASTLSFHSSLRTKELSLELYPETFPG